MLSWFKKHSYWIKWIVSILLLVLILFRIDIDNFYKSLISISWEYYAFAFVLNIVLQMVGALKWKVLLTEHTFRELFRLNLIACFYVFLIPSSFTGDATRAIKADKKNKGNEDVITSVIIDKWIGLFALVILMLTTFPFFSLEGLNILFIPVLALTISMLVISYLLYTGILLKAVTIISERFRNSPKMKLINLTKFCQLLLSISVAMKNHRAIVINFLLAALWQIGIAFGSLVLGNYMMININFWDFCLIGCILQLIMLLPLSIAGIGAKDVTLIALLGMAMVSSEKALAFSLAGYPITLLFVFIGYFLDSRKFD